MTGPSFDDIDRQALTDARKTFPRRTPPEGMCAEHRRIWLAWWDYANSYNPRHPRDYGNIGPIADSRISHAARRATYLRRGVEDLSLTERICRSGDSVQCVRRNFPPEK